MMKHQIGLLGSNSTHFEAYANALNEIGLTINLLKGSFDPSLITCDYNLSMSVQEFFDICGTILFTHRFGDDHYRELKDCSKYICNSHTLFIDKPICSNLQQLDFLADFNADSRASVFSFSPLTFAKETVKAAQVIKRLKDQRENATVIIKCPSQCLDIGSDPRFKSPLFYGIHATEILMQLLRLNSDSVQGYTTDHLTIHINTYSCLQYKIVLVPGRDEFYSLDILDSSGGLSLHSSSFELNGSYYRAAAEYIKSVSTIKSAHLIPFSDSILATKMLLEIEQ